ncbi:A-kinase anchor protein 8-like isoform X1 [Scleropages formosus]|uniref:A-kinase anchor protein 8-like isoform X1 n=1 Tax=Scleropages formosus TaxID=113540 RepID=UPI0010FAA6B0|nr:A-kinase anchor protein 8-like isoform X1 [Scleropages formosus]
MFGRGFASGGSSWGAASSRRGSTGYDLYGNKDSLSIAGGCNGGRGGRSLGLMRRGLSGDSQLPATGSNADAIIARINQRLNMLSQLEEGMQSSGRGERFDQYESFDSRPASLAPRDLFRSDSPAFGCGPGRPGGGRGGSGSSYGPAEVRMPRDAAPGPAWAAEPLSPGMGGTGGHGFSPRQDLPSLGRGYRGFTPGGQSKLPSLLSHHMSPEAGLYQLGPGLQNLSGRGHFGGGPRAGRQRGRKRPLNQQQPKAPQQDGQKKRNQKAAEEGKEPEVKKFKTELGAEEPSEEPVDTSGAAQEHHGTAGADGEPAGEHVLTMQERTQQANKQLQVKRPPQQSAVPKVKKRRGFLERVMFTCSICKFRSFYKEDMVVHLESRFHKEHFRFLSSQLSKGTTDFLQEYLQNKFKKTELRWKQTEKLSATICQVYREQDLTRGVGMEHFLRKVEAAHCAVCDLFIPMQQHLIQRHLRSPDHNYNRKFMMEQSKRSGLLVARSILNHKVISKKLESYLKGENPFAEGAEDKNLENVTVTEEQKDGDMSKVDPTKGALEGMDGQKEHKEGEAEDKEPCEELGEEDRGADDFFGEDEGSEGALEDDNEGLEGALGEDEDVEGFLREVDESVLAGDEDGDITE